MDKLNLNKYQKLLSFFSLSCTLFPIEAQNIALNKDKFNILFIAIDDLKPILGCYGDSLIKTPNIDKLAQMGIVFKNTYCQQAISGATRASLLTGLRPDHTRVYDLTTKIREINPDIITLPEHFKNAGYITCGVGKIFHPDNVIKEDEEKSWSIPYLTINDCYDKEYGIPVGKGYQDPETKRLYKKYQQEAIKLGLSKKKGNTYVKTRIMPSTECLDIPDNAYQDGAITIKAQQQLTRLASANKPFFMAVGYIKPHLPFTAPKKYWDLYQRNQIPIAEFQENAKNSNPISYHTSGELRQYTDIPQWCSFTDIKTGIDLNIEKQRELIHGYYACISYIDTQIGILMDTLEKLNLMNNTIIILWGDHGWHLGDHRLWNKHSNFEQATKVPLIIYTPNFKPGNVTSLAEFVDIYPTLCDLTGINIPQWIDGISLKPAMKNKNKQLHTYVVSQYPRELSKEEMRTNKFPTNKIMGYSIRTEKYRYTLWINIHETKRHFNKNNIYAEELYDYEVDPLETINLVHTKSYFNIKENLFELFLRYYNTNIYE